MLKSANRGYQSLDAGQFAIFILLSSLHFAIPSRIYSNCAAAGLYCKILPMLLVRPRVSMDARLAACFLLFGFFLIMSASRSATAQTPKHTSGQKHSPRHERLTALGLLAVPLEDDKVIKALSDSDWYIRGEAALAAARLGNKIPAKEITPLLDDSNWFVRSAALEALAVSGDPSAGPALKHLLDPEEPYLCARAAGLLGQIKYLAAEEPLIRMLSEGDDQVKRAAAAALASMKSQKAVDGLIGLLKHPSPGVRSAAAAALSRIGDSRAVDPVESAFK